MRPTWPMIGLAVLLSVALLPASLAAQPEISETGDTLSIVKGDETPSNADLAVRMADNTFERAPRVVVSRDDDFADALASGLLQAGAPLYLIPTDGPVPAEVASSMSSVEAAEAVILGGDAAVSTEVEDELTAMGLTTTRYEGLSRFETAVAIAEGEAPDADTLILARAFPAEGAEDPTQAYADAIAAGGLAAASNWPILLTQTDELTATTRDYLQRSGAAEIKVVGGTAAVSDAAFQEAVDIVGSGERIAGDGRAATAIEVAKARDAESAADVDRIILVDGEDTQSFAQATVAQDGLAGPNAWAGGFAAASHSAGFDAPIVLSAGPVLPPETEAFLADGIGGTGLRLVCVTSETACAAAREVAGLADAPPPPSDPPPVEGRGVVFLATTADPGSTPPAEGDGLYLVDLGQASIAPLVDGSCACPRQGAITADATEYVYLPGAEGEGPLTAVNLFTGAVRTITELPPAGAGTTTGPIEPAVGPDDTIAMEYADGEVRGIRFVALADGEVVREVPIEDDVAPGTSQYASLDHWTLGRTVTTLVAADGVIQRVDPSMRPAVAPFAPLSADHLRIAPDGSQVAAVAGDEVVLLAPDGSVLATVELPAAVLGPAAWTPDGTAVLVPTQGPEGRATVEITTTGEVAATYPYPADQQIGGGGLPGITPDSATLVRSVDGPPRTHLVDRSSGQDLLRGFGPDSVGQRLFFDPVFPRLPSG